MQRTVIALRALWAVLMAVLLALIVTNSIDAWGTVLYSLVVLAVMFAAQILQARSGQRRTGPRAAR